MNSTRAASLIAVLSLAAGCGGALCAAIACLPNIDLTLVDSADAGVIPGTGTITLEGTTASFDCAQDPALPATDGGSTGPLLSVVCTGNVVHINVAAAPPESIGFSVTRRGGGASFTGAVPLTFELDAPQSTCGSCSTAKKTLTLQ